MITVEFFAYSELEWAEIKAVVQRELGQDADQIKRQITRMGHTGMQSLRDRIEIVATKYQLERTSARQSPRRADLIALRKDIENMRASILDALTVQVGTKYAPDFAYPFARPGVDDDMADLTRDYFGRLARNLDRQIKQAGSREGNARKPARDQCWDELLVIWCELGGKPSGKAAGSFLLAVSTPVMGSAAPNIAAVVQWLKRRQRWEAQ
jgi:hypothetical protein